jgi:hypothetical protein
VESAVLLSTAFELSHLLEGECARGRAGVVGCSDVRARLLGSQNGDTLHPWAGTGVNFAHGSRYRLPCAGTESYAPLQNRFIRWTLPITMREGSLLLFYAIVRS